MIFQILLIQEFAQKIGRKLNKLIPTKLSTTIFWPFRGICIFQEEVKDVRQLGFLPSLISPVVAIQFSSIFNSFSFSFASSDYCSAKDSISHMLKQERYKIILKCKIPKHWNWKQTQWRSREQTDEILQPWRTQLDETKPKGKQTTLVCSRYFSTSFFKI